MWSRRAVILGAALACATRVAAQGTAPSLPQYTDDQRWGRLAALDLSAFVTQISFAREKGMTVDEIGTWLGEYYTQTWVGGLDARQLATSFRLNAMSHPRARVEMTTFTDTLVVMRSFATAIADFGPDRQNRGVTIDEYRKVYEHVNRIIAEHVGVALEQRYDGDWLVFTMRNKYRLPQATAELRWARASFIAKVVEIDAIRFAKGSGKTARAAGTESGKLWAATWTTADTPWRLFRGMTWNSMMDPNFVCELQSASTTVVRARCNRPWVATVNANVELTGVTVEEYEAFALAQAQAVATAIGMSWEEQADGDHRVITVRRR